MVEPADPGSQSTRHPASLFLRPLRFMAGVAPLLLVAAGLPSQAQLRPSQPEPPSGRTEKQVAFAKRHMVAAANPLAVEAGLAMLDRGGSAVDAAIAVQLVLTLVEPHASGLGGGAFLVHYDARRRQVTALDGRETAPEAVDRRLFLQADGKPMPFRAAVVGGRSVGVPGTPRLLEVAHARHGRLSWKALFEPAIALAERGFPVTPRLHELLSRDPSLPSQPAARAYFYEPDGAPKAVGTVLRNPALAGTLRAMAANGSDGFYEGEVARDLLEALRAHPNASVMTARDLSGYRVRDVEPLCGTYRDRRLCGMPPSSSGGIAVLQMLGILSHFDLPKVRPGSTEAVHLFAEAGRLAFADRNRYVGDDRFVDVPVAGLLDAGYLASRAALIRPEKSMGPAKPGSPPGAALARADDPVDEAAGTSHIAIVDAHGNAVSMTTTIEGYFGSKQLVRGFLLNNQLTDFNFRPAEDGRTVANAVAPGKRPRSSMAPFLGFDRSGRLDLVVGSPGGSLIINYVAKAIVASYDWNLDPQSAIDLPNMGSRNGPTEVEKGTALEAVVPALKALGHDARAIDMTSGLHAIRRVPGGWAGGADPRREGVARGR